MNLDNYWDSHPKECGSHFRGRIYPCEGKDKSLRGYVKENRKCGENGVHGERLALS